jgi:phospholipid/cholesterol/gamma-HCH transport system ATP-binding protein
MTPDSPRVEKVLRFEDVTVDFGGTLGLDHVSFELAPGETRILFGAAGSGKSTLLKTALGLIRPSSGRVFLFGIDITGLREQDLFDIRARVGILF